MPRSAGANEIGNCNTARYAGPEVFMLLDQVLDASEVARTLCVSRRRVYELQNSHRMLSSACSLTPDGYRAWFRADVEVWARIHPSQEERGPRPQLPGFGTTSKQVDMLVASATEVAVTLNHPRVQEDHLLVALADSACPGAAHMVLESLGVTRNGLLAQIQQRYGDPFDPVDSVPDRTQLAVAVGRAGSAAADLHDDVVCSEHVLMAVAERSPLLLSRQITTQVLRGRILAVTDPASDLAALPPVTQPHLAPRPLEDRLAGGLDLACSPAGHHPLNRKPWQDALLHGVNGRNFVGDYAKCLVDRDGHPVLTVDGRLIRCGNTGVYEPFDAPVGWWVMTWAELHARAEALRTEKD